VIIICKIHTFTCALLPDLVSVMHMTFYITFHVFYYSTMILHSLIHMGQSDYLYDNLNTEAILREKEIYIYIFYSF
jgi:hypothetical protein